MNNKDEKHYCLGHRNFGQLTYMVPGQNYKVYTNKMEALKDLDQIKKRNPQMKLLVCTPMGTPVRIAKSND